MKLTFKGKQYSVRPHSSNGVRLVLHNAMVKGLIDHIGSGQWVDHRGTNPQIYSESGALIVGFVPEGKQFPVTYFLDPV